MYKKYIERYYFLEAKEINLSTEYKNWKQPIYKIHEFLKIH